MIRLDLTPAQIRTVRGGAKHVELDIAEAKQAYVTLGAALRRASGNTGGRPKVLAPCRHCGTPLGARERRGHEANCGAKATKAGKGA